MALYSKHMCLCLTANVCFSFSTFVVDIHPFILHMLSSLCLVRTKASLAQHILLTRSTHLHMTVIAVFPELICTLFMFPMSSMMADVPWGVLHLDQYRNWKRVTVITVDGVMPLGGRVLYSESSRYRMTTSLEISWDTSFTITLPNTSLPPLLGGKYLQHCSCVWACRHSQGSR